VTHERAFVWGSCAKSGNWRWNTPDPSDFALPKFSLMQGDIHPAKSAWSSEKLTPVIETWQRAQHGLRKPEAERLRPRSETERKLWGPFRCR